MKKLVTPITAENFEENWNIVDSERRTAKKKYIMTKVASFFSNMVLTVLTLFAVNGLIHDHMSGSYCDFLETIPYLLPTWEKVSGFFLKPDQSWQVQVLLTALVVFAVSFLVCGLFVLIVLAIYHPFKRPLPTLTNKENAEQMLSMARDARRFANRSGDRGNAFWAMIFMIAQFALVALYALIGLGTVDSMMQVFTAPFMKLIASYVKDEFMFVNVQSSMFLPAVMLECLGMYLAYALIGTIHALTVNIMYRYKVPYGFVAEAEYHHVFADEETGEMTPEEIQAKRVETAQEWLSKGLEMEKISAYGKAKEFYAQAAHSGNAEAMEHYARHWLVMNAKDPARYWLQKCVATGNASETAVKNLRRLKWRRKVQAKYIK